MTCSSQTGSAKPKHSVLAVSTVVLFAPMLILVALMPASSLPAYGSQSTSTHISSLPSNMLLAKSATTPTAAAAASSSWGTPTPVDPNGGVITSVSCPASNFCMAVDSDGNAMLWNGSTWSVPELVDSSGAHLYSVSCPSASFCMAAGSGGYGVGYIDGQWTKPQVIDPSGGGFGITSVACVSQAFCMAVDGSGNALSWDGSTWLAPLSIDPGSGGMSVSCPSSSFCIAVDDNGRVVQYVAGAWGRPQDILPGEILSDISCASPSFCLATSYFGDALVFDGISWSSPVSMDSAGYDLSVSCPTSYYCVAVDGSGNAIVYNGVSWSTPSSVDTSGFSSVSCGSAESCVGVDTGGNALYYQAAPPPVLEMVSPSSGTVSGGTSVTITGSGFSSVKDVRFGSVAAASFKVISPTTISAVSPPAPSPSMVSITVSNENATSAPEATCGDSFTYGTSFPTQPESGYVALSPSRIADTRPSSGKPYAGDTLGACSTLDIRTTGAGDIPASGVAAVMLNITVADPSAPGYLSVYPAGSVRALSSNLNFTPGRNVANLVEVPVNPSTGQVAIYNGSDGAIDVVVDAEGYVPSSSSGYLYDPVSPVRVCDTRPGNPSGLSGGEAQCNAYTPGVAKSFNVNIGGVGGIPADATAAILNVTAANPVSPGYLSVYPAGSTVPDTSNVNFTSGTTVANMAIVPLSGTGAVSIYTSAATNVIVDVEGYFTTSTGSKNETVSPLRIADTRPGSGEPYAGRTLGSGSTLTIAVAGVAGVPDTATAVVLNVTVTGTTAPGYLTVYPAGVPRPIASNLNWESGTTLANMVVVKIGTSGAVDLYNYSGSTDVVVDVEGWYG